MITMVVKGWTRPKPRTMNSNTVLLCGCRNPVSRDAISSILAQSLIEKDTGRTWASVHLRYWYHGWWLSLYCCANSQGIIYSEQFVFVYYCVLMYHHLEHFLSKPCKLEVLITDYCNQNLFLIMFIRVIQSQEHWKPTNKNLNEKFQIHVISWQNYAKFFSLSLAWCMW